MPPEARDLPLRQVPRLEEKEEEPAGRQMPAATKAAWTSGRIRRDIFAGCLIPPRLSVVYLPEARSRASNNEEKTNVTKNKLSKLTLRRETLTVLEMKAATGGVTVSGNTIVVAQTVHSVCALCIPIPVIPPREWPQTEG
jgi:hypothetical protein